jgi:hypothetical protein
MYNANTMKYDQNWNRGWQHKERRYIYIYINSCLPDKVT